MKTSWVRFWCWLELWIVLKNLLPCNKHQHQQKVFAIAKQQKIKKSTNKPKNFPNKFRLNFFSDTPAKMNHVFKEEYNKRIELEVVSSQNFKFSKKGSPMDILNFTGGADFGSSWLVFVSAFHLATLITQLSNQCKVQKSAFAFFWDQPIQLTRQLTLCSLLRCWT